MDPAQPAREIIDNAPYAELTYRITGVAMRVHRDLQRGLREGEYQRALCLALQRDGLETTMEATFPILSDGAEIGTLRPDLLVVPNIPIEIKAVRHTMTNRELAQIITYVAAFAAPVGLYLNFGRSSLEHRRIFPPRMVRDQDTLKALTVPTTPTPTPTP